MEQLLKIIEEWPVIIQGALGSAIFALTVFLLQKLYKFSSHKFVSISKTSRISELNTEKVKLGLKLTTGLDKAQIAAPILYRAFRPLIKALIWLVLGLILGQVLEILSIVGYLGSLYYLFCALDIVAPYSFDGDPKERLQEINEEIESLKNNA